MFDYIQNWQVENRKSKHNMLFDRTALNKKDAIENEGIKRIYNAVVASGGTMRAALRQRETVKYIITLKCGKMINIGHYTAAMNHKCTWQRRIGLDGKHLNDHFVTTSCHLILESLTKLL